MRHRFLVFCLLMLVVAATASAQATRTWVSGVGDDVNPCSRTAPCKTFAGAISKTASGGIIDALDPGGFGTVTITKPITIEGTGTLASILASGVQGVIVNITSGSNRNVVLRDLQINGAGTTLGTNGINFIAGDSLTVEHCSIQQFSTTGILFQPNSNAQLKVTTSFVYLNAIGIRSLGVGAVTAFVNIWDTTVAKNGTGIQGDNNSKTTIRHCDVAGSTADGILGTSSSSCGMEVDFSVSDNNGTGVRANGAGTTVFVNNSTVSGNGTGVSSTNSGQICTYTNNRLDLNGTPGTFNCTGTQH